MGSEGWSCASQVSSLGTTTVAGLVWPNTPNPLYFVVNRNKLNNTIIYTLTLYTLSVSVNFFIYIFINFNGIFFFSFHTFLIFILELVGVLPLEAQQNLLEAVLA